MTVLPRDSGLFCGGEFIACRGVSDALGVNWWVTLRWSPPGASFRAAGSAFALSPILSLGSRGY